MTNRFMAGAARFAHFTGMAPSAAKARRAEEDDERDDEPKGRRSRADEGDDDEDDKPKGKKSSRAEEDDERDDEPKGRRSRADEGDDDEDDKPKGKKSSRRARAEDDDEDDDDSSEMNGKSAAANARRRERARCEAIFATPAAAGNVALACSLAFQTSMTRREAIQVLKTSGPAQSAGGGFDYSQRRQGRNPDIDASEGDAKPQSAGLWKAAHAKVAEQVGPKTGAGSSWGDAHARAAR